MMKFLRSQSQLVLAFVLVVIGAGFLFYGNAGNLLTSAGGHASNDFGRIDGEDLSVAQLYDAVRTTRESLMIHGQSQELMKPGASKQVAQEAWRQLLLLHEADKLHLGPSGDPSDKQSNKEISDYIKSLPIFQKDGVFNFDVYKTRMKDIQAILRIPNDAGVDATANTQAVFEKIVRTDLRVTAASTALFGNVHSSAHDLSDQYEKYNAPTTVSYVAFDPKTMGSSVQVAPAEIEKEYKDNPTNPAYRSKEKRKVDYVLFLLTPEQMKLPGDQKAKAKDALGEKATKFALTFFPDPSAAAGSSFAVPEFQAEAKKAGLTPQTTNFFAADESPGGLPPSATFNNSAFSLGKDNTISKVIELDNGMAVQHLAEIQASELRPLNEVKADIQKSLQTTKGQQAAEIATKNASDALKAAVAKGTDFKTAAAGMKLKVETIPAFVPMKAAPTDQRLQTIAYASTSLGTGQVSGPIPVESDNTVLVIHVDSRAKADAAGFEQFEKRFRESQDQQIRSLVYADWANWKNKQQGTHAPPDLEAYGSAE